MQNTNISKIFAVKKSPTITVRDFVKIQFSANFQMMQKVFNQNIFFYKNRLSLFRTLFKLL